MATGCWLPGAQCLVGAAGAKRDDKGNTILTHAQARVN